jgi:lipoprotein Spr
VLKVFIKFVLLIGFIISPFFAPHASAMESAGFKSKTHLSLVDISQFYATWKGVKYRHGGSTKRGIDCSALTQRVFKKRAISLPRTTEAQMRLGKHVPKHKLQPGDLVFFKTGKRQRHVGVYIGKGNFLHASTSVGVTISSLDNAYWQQKYVTSKRISA